MYKLDNKIMSAKGGSASGGRSIVIFYSRTGNTKLVAEDIATVLGSDLRPLIDKKNRKGILGYIWSGFDATMQNKTALEKFDLDLVNYDMIFLGTPNWAANVPPAIRTFLKQIDLNNKKLVLFCTQDGMGAGRVFNNIRLLAKGAEIVDEKIFNKVNQNKEAIRLQIRDWLGKLKI
jgi:flavodoxin